MNITRIIRTACIAAALASALSAAENDQARPAPANPTGLYLVIDLFPSRVPIPGLEMKEVASNDDLRQIYAITNLNAAPAGGWPEEYKTTRLVLRRIPAGTFAMGSPPDELGRDPDETCHPVTITRDFYLGVFEVTVKQWEMIMGRWEGYSQAPADRDIRPVERMKSLGSLKSLRSGL